MVVDFTYDYDVIISNSDFLYVSYSSYLIKKKIILPEVRIIIAIKILCKKPFFDINKMRYRTTRTKWFGAT